MDIGPSLSPCRVILVDNTSRLKSRDLRDSRVRVVGISLIGGAADMAIVLMLILSSRGVSVPGWELIPSLAYYRG